MDYQSLRVDSIAGPWRQGRTLFGGATVAIGLRTLETDLPLRSIYATFTSPAGADLEVESRIVREGRSVTFAEADVYSEGNIACSLSAVFGASRTSTIEHSSDPASPADRSTGIQFPYIEGITPEFTQNFDYVWCDGTFPFSGAESASFAGWCRHKTEPGREVDALFALADAWPSPALSMLSEPAPASTVTWSASVVSVPPVFDGWFWFESTAHAIHDGFANMSSRLFDEEGKLLLTSEQLVAVFG